MTARPDLVYHGTAKHYHKEQVKTFGRYQHVPEPGLLRTDDNYRVQLANNPVTGMNFALTRSQQYWSFPILLVVKTEIITREARLTWEPFLSCDFLEEGWYRVFPFKLKWGKFRQETFEELKRLEQEFLSL